MKALAKEGKSTQYILEKLKDFDFDAGTFKQSISNLENAWDQFTGKITESSFIGLKEKLNTVAGWINDFTNWLNKIDVENASIFKVTGEKNFVIKAQQLQKELDDIQDDLKNRNFFDDLFGDSEDVLKARERKIETQLRLLGNRIADSATETAHLVSANIDTKTLADITIGTEADIAKAGDRLFKEYTALKKKYQKDTKALSKIDEAYEKKRAELTKKSVKLYEKSAKDKAKADKKAHEEALRAYKAYLAEKKRVTEAFERDYTRTILGRVAAEKLALEKQFAEYRKYVDDKEKVEELYHKKYYDILYKDQDAQLKRAYEAYKAAGEKEIALEIEKVIKRNEIIDKYSDILTKDQLQKALELSDKQIEAAVKGIKRSSMLIKRP